MPADRHDVGKSGEVDGKMGLRFGLRDELNRHTGIGAWSEARLHDSKAQVSVSLNLIQHQHALEIPAGLAPRQGPLQRRSAA